MPYYRTVAGWAGGDVVALSAFGGEPGDPVAAAVQVDGRTALRVIAPVARRSWDAQTAAQFRAEVRRLAATHDLPGRTGPVTVLFDPPDANADGGTEPAGEPVERSHARTQNGRDERVSMPIGGG